MAKIKYYYDNKTLNYQRIEKSTLDRVKDVVIYLSASIFASIIIVMVFFEVFDSPRVAELEKKLEKKESDMQTILKTLSKEVKEMDAVLKDISHRDDNIYRSIFEANRIPNSIRQGGVGGVDRYKKLQNMSNSELIITTKKKIDKIGKQLYIQSKSFDELEKLAKNKANMLSSIPSIQPVANKNLTRMASGYGMRTHPIYKTRKFHSGMDFTCPKGTPIYATGSGTIEKCIYSRGGYGKHIIINHGYGFKTLYAHMHKYNVTKGQSVRRGEIIGYVGNTGLSVGPHLHYEVHKNGEKVNPAFYYYNDLTSEEYERMLELSSKNNQTLD